MLIQNQSNITYNEVMPSGEKSLKNVKSNLVITEILSYMVSKIISCDKTSVQEGEIACNTVTITNSSSTKMFNNIFKIPQLNGASFVEGSVKINGISVPDYDPIQGFTIPDLNANETVIIEYEIKATNALKTEQAAHFATLNYNVIDTIRGNVNYSENTDTILLKIISDKINFVKSVDKYVAVKGEKLHYTIKITNIGNITKTDMVFKDPIPYGTTFVANSVKVNGIGYSVYNPEIGFAIRSLAPNEFITIEFDVRVN